MDHNEKVGLIERVNHASEDQAKRTLRFMIVKCTVTQSTIARAIRDAIERHTPTPMIVYQQPESEDDDEAALVSSHKKSTKKKDQDGSGQEEDEFPSTISKERRSTRRGDINSDPLVGQLILKKTKTKTKGNKKHSSDHDEEKNNPNSPKKNRSRHASKLRAEPEQRTCDNSMGEPSQQKTPTVIDLVTSSDDETCDSEHSENESLDDGSSDNDGSDNESPYDDSSEDENADDEDPENEQQDDVLPGATRSTQDNSNNKVSQASANSGEGGRSASHSITISMAKASNLNDGNEMSPLCSVKKRKAPEHAMEEMPNHQPAKIATGSHVHKRSKKYHPQEPQTPPEQRTCRKCGILFPSMAQLLKHRHYCKGFAANFGSHHRSEPPSDDRSRRLEKVQKASNPASENFTDQPHNTLRLPSRPLQRASAARESSQPPPSFVHEPNNFPRGLKGAYTAFPGHASDPKSPPPQDLAQTPEPGQSSDSRPNYQSRPPEPESLRQHLLKEVSEEAVHRCRLCKKWYRDSENVVGVCSCHPGTCRSHNC